MLFDTTWNKLFQVCTGSRESLSQRIDYLYCFVGARFVLRDRQTGKATDLVCSSGGSTTTCCWYKRNRRANPAYVAIAESAN
jgi:hypothetical protein